MASVISKSNIWFSGLTYANLKTRGIVIMLSKLMNIALLSKWLWHIANGKGGLWLDILKAKYLRG